MGQTHNQTLLGRRLDLRTRRPLELSLSLRFLELHHLCLQKSPPLTSHLSQHTSPRRRNKSYQAVPDEYQMTGIDIRGFKDLEEGEIIVHWEVQRGFFKRGGERSES